MNKFIIASFLVLNAYSFMPKSFSTSYVQKYKSKLSRKMKESKGSFDYKYPGKIKFSQTLPTKLVVTSNKSKTWIYTPPFDKGDKGQVTIGSGGDSLSKFFDLLTNGLKSNEGFEVKTKDSISTLTLNKELSKELGIKTVEFNFNKKTNFKSLKNIKINYNDKRIINLELTNINENVNFPKGHFIFKTPKGAKTTYQ